ncbi:YggS family pyridoxal phosphate-dependent enzyme [Quadrisphaera sp. DSM 44207]|uniref:YggS family pyridoxal phosphate-dependent enzyme n=1 Tax=Quadrisphaera sp. DSM 44207 TaxID=1881057 RepID=UPI00087F5B79|nr:YggS family pyridoxal phosphate-dependent enzyme [Quadrisphaera sp. DSM 44207]SDQ53415.1 hypothetical protein SAMN05428996_2075 [Quadrisphaera sp. DSM 44207]
MSERRAELAAGLGAVRERLAAAATAAGRDPRRVVLVVVTKTFPASDVRLLAGLGVADAGESREPEASAKAAACADLPLRWHQVGRVQTNKAAAVAAWADVVHSVDRSRLAGALSRAAARTGRELGCFVQVSLDGDPARGGVAAQDLPALVDEVAAAPGLRLEGLMAVAPTGEDPARAFERLARLGERVRADHPGAGGLSAGMSEDLEAAVAVGATHVRVGRAVLGSRPAVQ